MINFMCVEQKCQQLKSGKTYEHEAPLLDLAAIVEYNIQFVGN